MNQFSKIDKFNKHKTIIFLKSKWVRELSYIIFFYFRPLLFISVSDAMEFKRPRSSRRRLRPPKIQWPASNKDILKLFTLSRTNQILRGRSPILQDKEGEFKDQGVHKAWSELVASEILSAKVDVVPKPLEYNVGIVSSDPRKGRYVYSFFINMVEKI